MADLLIASFGAGFSFVGIFADNRNRSKFNKFLESKEIGDCVLVEGTLRTEQPLEFQFVDETGAKPVNVVLSSITRMNKNYHTIHGTKNIYQSGNLSINVPVQETRISWRKVSKQILSSPKIFVGNCNIFFSEPKFVGKWPVRNEHIVNDIKIIQKFVPVNSYLTVFGRKNNQNEVDVKFIGNNRDVIAKIKSSHFNIDDGLSFILIMSFVLSTGYLGNGFVNSFGKKN